MVESNQEPGWDCINMICGSEVNGLPEQQPVVEQEQTHRRDGFSSAFVQEGIYLAARQKKLAGSQ